MDAKTLQARLDVARSFKHSIGHIEFRCRLIPEYRVASIYDKHRGSNVDAARALLAETVLGMSGATVADMGLDGSDPLDDSKETAMLLLDDRQDISVELAAEIAGRVNARAKAIGDDAKNSSSGSATT